MKQLISAVVIAVVMGSGNPCAAQYRPSARVETLRYEDFGIVHVYRESRHPANMVLFISGERGWGGPVVDMAQALASLDTMVVGIDVTHYLRSLSENGEQCSYYSYGFEDLSHYVQQKLGFPRYIAPILAGYSMDADVLTFMAARLPSDLLSKVSLIALLGPSPTVDFEFHFTEWLGTVARKSRN